MSETISSKRIIELYKSFPCLWNSAIASHRDKDARHDALSTILVEAGREVNEINIIVLKRKINSFRTTYTRELSKVLQADSDGVVYKPRWAHYATLDSFLQPMAIANKHSLHFSEASKRPFVNQSPDTEQPLLVKSEIYNDWDNESSNNMSDEDDSSLKQQLPSTDVSTNGHYVNISTESLINNGAKKIKFTSDTTKDILEQKLEKSADMNTNFVQTVRNSCSSSHCAQNSCKTSSSPLMAANPEHSNWTYFGLYIAKTLESFDPLNAASASSELQGVLAKYLTKKHS